MKIECIEKEENVQELLPQVVERIFKVCRNDSSFKLKDDLNSIEDIIYNTNKKIEKQKQLLEKSSEIKSDLMKRLREISNENELKQIRLLEMIGEE